MSGEKHGTEKTHASLGASSASRWVPCPGSVRMSEGLPDTTSEHAQEGTRAHSVAELSLAKCVAPDTFVGLEIEGGIVDDDMGEYLRTYVDLIADLKERCGSYWWVERRFNLAALNPPTPMFGTADFVGVDSIARHMYVVDLKYGRGVVVEVKNNMQLRYYALGALLSLDEALRTQIDEVEITIVQPRALHPDGPIRSEIIPVYDLVQFAAELMAAARATLDPNAPLVAGPQCRWCKASGACPEQRRHALEIVQGEFDVVEEFVPPSPDTIPVDEFAAMLGKIHVLEDWIKAMRQTAFTRLQRGEVVPGFKLVAKRAMRTWSDEETAEQLLLATGFNEAEIHVEPELKSVAQIEKLLGKKKFAVLLAASVKKESSGYNMAPAHDARPSVSLLTVGEEFAALTSGEEDEQVGHEQSHMTSHEQDRERIEADLEDAEERLADARDYVAYYESIEWDTENEIDELHMELNSLIAETTA